jgi:phosphatidylinositol alpha-1,6-mannosyltransferase
MYMPWYKYLPLQLARFPGVWLAARRSDLIHCLCDYPFSVPAWLAGRLARKPVIVSGHGTYSVAPFRYPLHRSLIRRSYAGADRVLFGSSFALQKFEEQCRLPFVEVVDYGIDVSMYADHDLPPPERVKPPYLLCVGEVKERKGHHVSMRSFLGAAERHPDLAYAVVGHFVEDDPYYLELKRLIAEKNCTDRVVFLGTVTEEEKRSLYSHCEAFILTPVEGHEGSFEALGLVFLEAGACGVPVIGTYDSGAICAIKDGENGFLIRPERPEDGAAAIGKILEDPGAGRRMGEKGKQMALQRTWSRVGERLERIYQELI